MNLVLLNLQSNQQIKLDNDSPLIIGRGNVNGCYDKRVSRSHGKITCTPDGKIHLVALHCNPCFFTRNGVPPVLQLNKNEEETLSEGDCLGLLPNAFWFQVTTNKEIKVKTEPKDIDIAETVANNVEKTVNVKLSENDFQKSSAGVSEDVKCMSSLNTSGSNSLEIPTLDTETVTKSETTYKGYGTPEFEKTRRLPIWMYEIDESIESAESDKNPKQCLKNNQKTQSKKRKAPSSNPDTSEIKKEPNVNSLGDTDKKDENEIIYVASTSKLARVQESDSSPHQASSSNSQTQKESSKVTNHKEGYESDVNTEVEILSKRPVCQYEEKCFRKNPQHKLDFSHPGDADFTPYEERPLCQYGSACYRKNEKHRVEFRHPPSCSSTANTSSSSSHTSLASPLPSKRRREKVTKQNSDYEDDDEYDLEDPFINDASSDEYIPSDSNSEVEDLEDFDTSQESKR